MPDEKGTRLRKIWGQFLRMRFQQLTVSDDREYGRSIEYFGYSWPDCHK